MGWYPCCCDDSEEEGDCGCVGSYTTVSISSTGWTETANYSTSCAGTASGIVTGTHVLGSISVDNCTWNKSLDSSTRLFSSNLGCSSGGCETNPSGVGNSVTFSAFTSGANFVLRVTYSITVRIIGGSTSFESHQFDLISSKPADCTSGSPYTLTFTSSATPASLGCGLGLSPPASITVTVT